jgi:hypothetical protein
VFEAAPRTNTSPFRRAAAILPERGLASDPRVIRADRAPPPSATVASAVDGTTAAEIALLVALLAIWIVVVRDAWRAWQPARLLLSGRYADALVAAQRLERSWMRVFRSVRHSARYAVGCALHLEGELDPSLEALAPLHRERLRGNMRYAICSIDAASLVLLDREHARARELLEEAGNVHQPPEDILLAAHASHGLGEKQLADALFEKAGSERRASGLRLGSVLLIEDRRQQEAIFHTLRGLYLVKVGRGAEAQRDFDIAAKNPVTNVYVERARAMRQARAVDGGDPRSSLAPQVVDEPGEDVDDGGA